MGLGVEALTAGCLQAVAVGVLAGGHLQTAAVGRYPPHPIDALGIALCHVEVALGAEGDGLGLVEGGALNGVGRVVARMTVKRPAQYNL
jgi:hypothetical protein